MSSIATRKQYWVHGASESLSLLNIYNTVPREAMNKATASQ
jgi:hypothetical protein